MVFILILWQKMGLTVIIQRCMGILGRFFRAIALKLIVIFLILAYLCVKKYIGINYGTRYLSFPNEIVLWKK